MRLLFAAAATVRFKAAVSISAADAMHSRSSSRPNTRHQHQQHQHLRQLQQPQWCGQCTWAGSIVCDSRAKYLVDLYPATYPTIESAQSFLFDTCSTRTGEPIGEDPPCISLDAYCGECQWQSMSFDCDNRVAFLMANYQLEEDTAKQELINQGQCITPSYDITTDPAYIECKKAAQAAADATVIQFCPECMYKDTDFTCKAKAEELRIDNDGMTLEEARASILKDCFREVDGGGDAGMNDGQKSENGVQEDEESSSLSGGAIAGIVICLLLLLLCCILGYLYYQRKRRSEEDEEEGGKLKEYYKRKESREAEKLKQEEEEEDLEKSSPTLTGDEVEIINVVNDGSAVTTTVAVAAATAAATTTGGPHDAPDDNVRRPDPPTAGEMNAARDASPHIKVTGLEPSETNEPGGGNMTGSFIVKENSDPDGNKAQGESAMAGAVAKSAEEGATAEEPPETMGADPDGSETDNSALRNYDEAGAEMKESVEVSDWYELSGDGNGAVAATASGDMNGEKASGNADTKELNGQEDGSKVRIAASDEPTSSGALAAGSSAVAGAGPSETQPQDQNASADDGYKDTVAPHELTDNELSKGRELMKSKLKIADESQEDEASDLLDYAFDMLSEGQIVGGVVEELIFMEMEVLTADMAEDFGRCLSDFLLTLHRGTASPKDTTTEKPSKEESSSGIKQPPDVITTTDITSEQEDTLEDRQVYDQPSNDSNSKDLAPKSVEDENAMNGSHKRTGKGAGEEESRSTGRGTALSKDATTEKPLKEESSSGIIQPPNASKTGTKSESEDTSKEILADDKPSNDSNTKDPTIKSNEDENEMNGSYKRTGKGAGGGESSSSGRSFQGSGTWKPPKRSDLPKSRGSVAANYLSTLKKKSGG